MKDFLTTARDRLFRHWKSTILGTVLILFTLGHILYSGGDAMLHTALVGFGVALLGAKDPEGKGLHAVMLASYFAIGAAASGCTPSLEACRQNHPCPQDMIVHRYDTLITLKGPDARLNIPAPEISPIQPVYLLDTVIVTKEGPVRVIYTETAKTRDVHVDCPDTSAVVDKTSTLTVSKGYQDTPINWKLPAVIAASITGGLVALYAGIKVANKFL